LSVNLRSPPIRYPKAPTDQTGHDESAENMGLVLTMLADDVCQTVANSICTQWPKEAPDGGESDIWEMSDL
jgi:hypothetical protein